MANTQQVLLSASFKDGDGVAGTARAYAKVDPGSTITQALAMLTSYLTKLVACSDAGLVGASLSIVDLASPVGVTGAVADSSVDEVGTLDFIVTDSGRTSGFPIPALKDALILGSKIVSDTGPAQALADLLSTGETGITYTNSGFQALGALSSTFRSDRKSKRALRQLSRSQA